MGIKPSLVENEVEADAARAGAVRRARETFDFGSLAGSFATAFRVPGTQLGLTSDGIGTKIEVAERLQQYDTLGTDLVAMVADDLAACGFEPLGLSNVLDVDRVDRNTVDALMAGLSSAARAWGLALWGGEIAELSDRVAGFGTGMHFNWSATAVGALRDGWQVVDGTRVEVGDAIIAIHEPGFRSNGFRQARALLQQRLGADWHSAKWTERESWGQALLAPSVVTCGALTALRKVGIVPSGIAHVTGGGIPKKLLRVLRASGRGAKLDRLFEPGPALKALLSWGLVSDEAAYRTWNMGHAALVVVRASDAESALSVFSSAALRAQVCGTIVEAPGVEIASRGESTARLTFA